MNEYPLVSIVGTAIWDLTNEEMGKKTGAKKKGETIKKYSEWLIALEEQVFLKTLRSA